MGKIKIIIKYTRIGKEIDKWLRLRQEFFRKGRGITKEIYILRNIIENEQSRGQIYINFTVPSLRNFKRLTVSIRKHWRRSCDTKEFLVNSGIQIHVQQQPMRSCRWKQNIRLIHRETGL